MKVLIPEDPLQQCKEEVQKYMKSQAKFREIGGYLIGTFQGDFIVQQFILDTNAQSTSTRIKLSFDCFERVEKIVADNPDNLYIGTWHVHPGKTKPAFSHTDKSTLFLERLVIETDNPQEYNCPRIHIIFNENLELTSAYTMQVEIETELRDYWSITKNLTRSDLEQLEDLIMKLNDTKAFFKNAIKKFQPMLLEDSFYYLGQARGNLDQLMDTLEDVCEFAEFRTTLKTNQDDFETKLISTIKKGETIGIFYLQEDETVGLANYRPTLIKEYLEDGLLMGFWRHYPLDNPPLEFQNIFFANFYKKVEESPNSYIYLISSPSGFQYFQLKIIDYTGISFKAVDIVQEATK